ncbi:P-loop NTPase fold protein [Bacillus wiedmannii]|uniref:KAP family P-loop NTPase fold protein n=1 Tax=Bacillus wiedmannii TaxID=1890302 RepID=UPI002E1BB672|nr:P-loop NTPase fold protein [Bacillus wiedmannii]
MINIEEGQNEFKSKERWIKYIWRISNSIIVFILLNLILTIARNSFHNKIPVDFLPISTRWGLYILVGILMLLFFTLYLTSLSSTITVKNEVFSSISDYIVLIVPLSIIINYFFINTPLSFGTGSILSDLFDMVMIFSILINLCFIVGLILRFFMTDKPKTDNEEQEYYSSGNPIENESEDKLNRAVFAKRIANALEKQGKDSLTIGLLGEWGSGKSSVYNLIKESSDDSKMLFVDFKPWYFGENNHDIIRLYLLQFLEGIKKTEGYSPEIGKALQKYANVFSSVSIRTSGTIVSIKELISSIIPNKETLNLSEIKKEIENLLKEYPKRIVVYIDDIDRLEGTEIRMIFKLVRLVADFPNITYILALDEEIVKRSLSSVYEFEKGGNVEDSKKYIDKFIQVPIYLPKPDNQDLYHLTLGELSTVIRENEITGNYKEEIIKDLIELNLSPRNITRYINLVRFYLPFLKEEVNIRDLLYLLLIQVSSPEIYHYIYMNKPLFIEGKGWEERQVLNDPPSLYGYKNILTKLFPYTTEFFNGKFENYTQSKQKEWLKEKRICSSEFFNQYFMYNIPRNSLSQSRLTDFINDIHNENLNAKKIKYLNLINEYNISEVNKKLEYRLSELNEYKSHLFIILLETYQEKYKLFKNDEDKKSIPFLARLLVDLLKDENYDLLEMDWSKSHILFTVEIYKHLERNNCNKEKMILFKKIVQNAYIEQSKISFYKQFTEIEAEMLWREWRRFFDIEEIKECVENWINSEEDFEEFLNYFFRSIKKHTIFEEEILISVWVAVIDYLSEERIQEYFQKYDSPKNKDELLEYVKREGNYNIGVFILAKNKLFEYICNIYENALKASVGQSSSIRFKPYIDIGANLIIKFGGFEQQESIENFRREIDEFNKKLNDQEALK